MRAERRHAAQEESKPKRRFQRRARQQEDKEQLRTKFIEIARKEFASHDVEDVSLRRIAAIAGYSQGTLYQYFPSRIALLIAVKEQNFQEIVGKISEIAGRTRDPRQRIERIMSAYIGYWLEHPDHFKSLFSMSGTIEDRRMPDGTLFGESEIARRAVRVFIDAVAALFEDHQARANPELLDLLTRALLCAGHGVVALPYGTPSMTWPDVSRIGKAVVEALLHSWETKLQDARRRANWPKVERSVFL